MQRSIWHSNRVAVNNYEMSDENISSVCSYTVLCSEPWLLFRMQSHVVYEPSTRQTIPSSFCTRNHRFSSLEVSSRPHTCSCVRKIGIYRHTEPTSATASAEERAIETAGGVRIHSQQDGPLKRGEEGLQRQRILITQDTFTCKAHPRRQFWPFRL